MSLDEILRLLDRTFQQHEIRYAIIGAYAVAAWGNLRATRDINLLAEPPNVERLEQALATAKLDFEIQTGDSTDPILRVYRVVFGQLKSHEWARM
ncbi:MAG: hypothetical protein ACE5HM_05250 [Acidiferrobacterales bacterium]